MPKLNTIKRVQKYNHLVLDISTEKHPNALMKINEKTLDRIVRENNLVSIWPALVGNASMPYAISFDTKKKKRVYVHVLIGKQSGEITDHANRNTLDNRDSNLRCGSKSQNSMNRKQRVDNTSGKTGVYFCKNHKTRPWMAIIRINKKTVCLGFFQDKQDAIIVRKQAEKKFYKQFKSSN